MLWESFFSGDKFGQVPLIAELGDNVGIVFGGVNVIDFNDIFGVFEVFEDLHFWNQKVLMDIPFDVFHIDYFNGYGLVWIKRSVLVRSFLPWKTWLE